MALVVALAVAMAMAVALVKGIGSGNGDRHVNGKSSTSVSGIGNVSSTSIACHVRYRRMLVELYASGMQKTIVAR